MAEPRPAHRPAHRHRSTARRTLWLLVPLLWLPLATGSTWSGLTATTSSTGNELATAASFDWEPVPASATTPGTSPVNDTSSAWTPRLADVAGAPWVVWAQTNGAQRVLRVKAWDGSTWSDVGGSFGTDVRDPSIVAVDGTVYVAWAEAGSPTTIRVARWTGSTWQTVQASSQDVWNLDNQKNAARPRTTALGTELWVVWHELDSSGSYWQVKWRSYNTVTSTSGGTGVMAYDNAKQAVDPDVANVGGQAWVVYAETNNAGVSTIRVRRPSGGLGTELNVDPTRPAYAPAIAVGDDGMPHIAFREQTSGCWQLRTRRWNGSTWEVTGGSTLEPASCAASSFGTNYPGGLSNLGDPSLAVVGGTTWLSWAEIGADGSSDVVVARYSPGSDRWVRTSVVDVDGSADAVTAHVVGSDGRGYVAFAEWDGSVWKARVAGS